MVLLTKKYVLLVTMFKVKSVFISNLGISSKLPLKFPAILHADQSWTWDLFVPKSTPPKWRGGLLVGEPSEDKPVMNRTI